MITDFNVTQGDVFIFNGVTQTGIGNSVSIVGGVVQINQPANAIAAGLNTFFISGSFNEQTNEFLDVINGGTDYLIFQAQTNAIAANQSNNLVITTQFNAAEAIILTNPALG